MFRNSLANKNFNAENRKQIIDDKSYTLEPSGISKAIAFSEMARKENGESFIVQ